MGTCAEERSVSKGTDWHCGTQTLIYHTGTLKFQTWSSIKPISLFQYS